jgi:hypothetical protein
MKKIRMVRHWLEKDQQGYRQQAQNACRLAHPWGDMAEFGWVAPLPKRMKRIALL